MTGNNIFNEISQNFDKVIIVTGGAGFIGSHLIRHLVKKYPNYWIINVDKVTYAGNLENLKDIEKFQNYAFVRADICDYDTMMKLFEWLCPTGIIHLAAESHVDNSIKDPFCFAKTNVIGTLTLLQAAKNYWSSLPEKFEGKRFYHVSTDEVYGSLDFDINNSFNENTKYDPHSPYSASKASSDHFVRAYHDTYGLPTVISNCSNNYGPNQFPEKLIPLIITNLMEGKELPVYGTGENVRDWLYVQDHVQAIDLLFHKAESGSTYNIGGNCQKSNIEIVYDLCDLWDELNKNELGTSRNLVKFVEDRAGHDLRYAIDASKLKKFGWEPEGDYKNCLQLTVEWYINNKEWIEHIKTGEYKNY